MADASNMSQKEYLKKLKETDPEFYKTMMQSSEVLDMKSSDEEEESENEEEEENENENEEEDSKGMGVHSHPEAEVNVDCCSI